MYTSVQVDSSNKSIINNKRSNTIYLAVFLNKILITINSLKDQSAKIFLYIFLHNSMVQFDHVLD